MKKKALFLLGFLIVVAILSAVFYFDIIEKSRIKYYMQKAGINQEEVIKNLDNIKKWSDKIQEDNSNFDYYIELARAHRYLGNTDKSIEIYKSYPYEKQGTVLYLYHNNLAKIYEYKKDCEEANNHYLEIIKNFKGQYSNTYLFLTKNYIILQDKDSAWKYYIEFQKTGGEDIEILKKLEKM
ncbi:hypothetical protein KAI52_00975 [Candidatus Parcubacteria bacterium]|nr:hypothetical protein [Candidatus Parcubacteria bacterium]